VNTVFWEKKDCISKVRAQEESGRETNKKASREGITRNPRGLPENQASLICHFGQDGRWFVVKVSK
jgi:hypothetical protein